MVSFDDFFIRKDHSLLYQKVYNFNCFHTLSHELPKFQIKLRKTELWSWFVLDHQSKASKEKCEHRPPFERNELKWVLLIWFFWLICDESAKENQVNGVATKNLEKRLSSGTNLIGITWQMPKLDFPLFV